METSLKQLTAYQEHNGVEAGRDAGEQQQAEHTGEAVHALVNSIQRKLQQAKDEESRRRSPPTIHRVRPNVREEDPWAYDPKVVSLGPFHRGKSGLDEMEKLKWRFANHLLARSPQHSVTKYVCTVLACATRARDQYSGDIVDLHPDAFLEIMLLDGCFVLECLLKRWLGPPGSLEGELASAKCNTTLLRNDLLLLENQVPFLVVKALFDASEVGQLVTPTELAASFLKINIFNNYLSAKPSPTSVYHHLLHLFHSSLDPAENRAGRPMHRQLSLDRYRSCYEGVTRYLRELINLVSPIFYGTLYLVLMCQWPWQSPPGSTKQHRFPRMIPCATELREAGISIKRRHFKHDTEACLLKVSFHDGTLEIPFVSVEESTNSMFRNLVAFEQSCPSVGNYFTSYAIFMDNIINTAADVGVLRTCRVMESKLGCDEQVAQMFNTVCKGSVLNYEEHYLAPLFRDVKRYCETSRHRWRARLMHDYFNRPWAAISVVVASLLLLFTGMQAVFAVLAYFRPPRP